MLLVTHNVLEAERAVDRLAIIDKGKVVAMGTPAELRGQGESDLRLELVLEPGVAPPEKPGFLPQAVVLARRFIATVPPLAVTQAVEWARGLKERGTIEEFSVGPATLEDTYIRLIGRPDALGMTEEVSNVPVRR